MANYYVGTKVRSSHYSLHNVINMLYYSTTHESSGFINIQITDFLVINILHDHSHHQGQLAV